MKLDRIVLERIVSGGQTGADRAALDWALGHGFPHGGWCPKGRKAEDGVIPERYQLRPTPSSQLSERTEWNVRDSDGTVIFSLARDLKGGSLLTQRLAARHRRPWLHLAAEEPGRDQAMRLRAFLSRHAVRVVNVAGPRASQEPGVAAFVQAILEEALGQASAGPARSGSQGRQTRNIHRSFRDRMGHFR